mmetsp:Transcript_67907/g.209976  ORF Transcript_67907/g.209976 Transcript_67907/m.209976 type:complete len:167 (+) Transcript_67907:3-503(+)
MLLISTSCVAFTLLKIGHCSFDCGSLAGLFFVLVWIFCNILASLVSERVFKAHSNLPFIALMTSMALGELLTSCGMLYWAPEFQHGGFFSGWDWSTLAVLATMMGDEWLSALMVKRLSTVGKVAAKCASLVALYVISLASGAAEFYFAQAVAAFMVISTVAVFPFL